MTKGLKVLIVFLVAVIAAILLGAFYYDIQEQKRYYKEYQHLIMSLNDSISILREDFVKYQEEISKLDLERENIHNEIEIILKENEKIDAYLANGDWDYNIKFLTEFLSREDSVPE